jgi:hypothetical protein
MGMIAPCRLRDGAVRSLPFLHGDNVWLDGSDDVFQLTPAQRFAQLQKADPSQRL